MTQAFGGWGRRAPDEEDGRAAKARRERGSRS